ncbi:hypothetical protein [Marinobacter shengliensis]|uniref:hypothetical protein n=1 Tax=Marinobacter shengliensis TaxID=1389223 RepID=UPI0035B6EEEA
MVSRVGWAWLLLPLPAVIAAFLYSGWVFGSYFWGYLGLMQVWTLAFIIGFGLLTATMPRSSVRLLTSHSRSDVRWDCILLILGALAIGAVFYDRYFIRGIDYFSVGIARAREQLNQGSYQSSVFSVFGNFFLYCYVFPLVRSILFWEERRLGVHFFIIAVVVIELIGVSVLMGGRTALLLLITFGLGSFVARRTLCKPYRPLSLTYSRLLLISLVSLIAFGFFFALRSHAFGDSDSFSYFLNICGHLTTGAALECDFGAQSGAGKDAVNYLHLVLLYGTHGTWMTEDIVGAHWAGGWITPQGLYSLVFSRFGLDQPQAAYGGYFIPAPGALLNDFGLWGVVLFALAFGAFAGVLAQRQSLGQTNLATYVLVFAATFWFLSFLIFPTNIPGFVITAVLGLFLWIAHLCITNIASLFTNRHP